MTDRKMKSGVKAKCTLAFEHEKSRLIADAVRPDNTPNIIMRVTDSTITFEVTAITIGSLIATVDDYLINVKTAQDMVEMAFDTNQKI